MSLISYLKRKYSPVQLRTVLSTILIVNDLEKALEAFYSVDKIYRLCEEISDEIYVHICRSKTLSPLISNCILTKSFYEKGIIDFNKDIVKLDRCVFIAFKHGFLGRKISVYNFDDDETTLVTGYIHNSKDDTHIIKDATLEIDGVTSKMHVTDLINFSGKDISNRCYGINSLPKFV